MYTPGTLTFASIGSLCCIIDFVYFRFSKLCICTKCVIFFCPLLFLVVALSFSMIHISIKKLCVLSFLMAFTISNLYGKLYFGYSCLFLLLSWTGMRGICWANWSTLCCFGGKNFLSPPVLFRCLLYGWLWSIIATNA